VIRGARSALAALALSATALVGLVSHEGYKATAYIPVPGDVPTLGYGTTTGVKLGDRTDPITALQAALLDVNRFEGALKQCVNAPLYQHEYDAFISLSYNIGSGAFCKSTLVKKLNAGDYAGACAEISNWVYFKGKKLNGLVARRAKERAMCEGKADGKA
jgi:lysozyme